MRAIEQAAIASGKVTGLELMERAGQGVVEAIFEEWPEFAKKPHKAVILCGPGNNGGDGFVVARLLKEAGWEVEVFLYGDPEKLPPDARTNYGKCSEKFAVNALTLPTPSEGEIACLLKSAERTVSQKGPDLIVDALFGTGLTRPFHSLSNALEEIQVLGERANDSWWPRLVSIDVPSGLCADSGRTLDASDDGAVGAHLTITFHSRKLGHVLGSGAQLCGKIQVVPLGIERNGKNEREALASLHGLIEPGAKLGRVIAVETAREELSPYLTKEAYEHKYTHGHALILSGGPGKGGAARLAARGALRIGAGVVTLGCPPAAVQENAAQMNAIMLASLKGGEGLASILEDTRINALCVGPGLGTSVKARALLAEILRAPVPAPGPQPRGPGSGPGRAVVLDADALTLLAAHEELFVALHDKCVLTPHAGEFARLFLDIAEKLNAPATKGPTYSKVDATRDAAKRAGCTILFKGPDTVIADPKGRASINSAQYERAAPWLATAGSGDVLAGFITGLLARGFAPKHAAETAAWLHVECALKFGPGLIAEDIPEMLPLVFRDLGV